MKMKLTAFVLIAIFACSFAFADTTGRSFWHSHSYTDNDSYVDKYSEYQEREGIELGAIASVIMVREELFGIPYTLSTQGQYDVNNNNWGIYGKVEIDISKQIKGLLGIK